MNNQLNQLHYLNIRDLLSGRLIDVIASCALLYFLLSGALDVVMRTIIPVSALDADISFVIDNAVLGVLIICYYYLKNKAKETKLTVWPFYFLIWMFILFSLLFNNQYFDWYFHEKYGMFSKFLSLNGGIYALLFVSMVNSKERLVSVFVYAARLNLVFYIMQYINATRRGYWISAFGAKIPYSLEFGYDVAIGATIFLFLFVINRKKPDLICFVISAMMILLQGSRGALGCVAAAVCLAVLYVWKRSKKKVLKYSLAGLFFAGMMVAFYLGSSFFFNIAVSHIKSLNINSRSVQMFVAGSLAEGNGREMIWNIGLNAIKNSDFLGYGFYGDRFIIGKWLMFGYPHNFFIEMLMEFGVVLGLVLIILLIWNVARMGIKCRDISWRFMYFFMLSSCSKLLLSDSFWYYWPFWSLIGVCLIWRKQTVGTGKDLIKSEPVFLK